MGDGRGKGWHSHTVVSKAKEEKQNPLGSGPVLGTNALTTARLSLALPLSSLLSLGLHDSSLALTLRDGRLVWMSMLWLAGRSQTFLSIDCTANS